jgi:Tfp pilus assembly protein PilN
MRARLNLATKPLVTHRRFLVGAAAVAIVAGIVFLALGWNAYSANRADAKLQQQIREIRAERADQEARREKLKSFFSQPENAKLSDRAAYLNSIIDQSSFLWTQMFMDIEHVKPAGVRVLSISQKMVKGNMEVRLKVGASSDEAKLKFIRALEGSKAFGRVMLISDQQSTQSGGDPDVFEISAIYTRA